MSPRAWPLLGLIPALLLAGWADSWEALRQAMSQVESVQADFVQTKRMKILRNPLVSRGRFAFRPPADIRWEYESPVRTLMVMKKGEPARYLFRDGRWERDAQARLEALRVVMERIAGWMGGRFDEAGPFEARLIPEGNGQVELLPRDPAMREVIERIRLHLSPTPGALERIELFEPGDSATEIRFENLRLNAPLSDSLFEAAP